MGAARTISITLLGLYLLGMARAFTMSSAWGSAMHPGGGGGQASPSIFSGPLHKETESQWGDEGSDDSVAIHGLLAVAGHRRDAQGILAIVQLYSGNFTMAHIVSTLNWLSKSCDGAESRAVVRVDPRFSALLGTLRSLLSSPASDAIPSQLLSIIQALGNLGWRAPPNDPLMTTILNRLANDHLEDLSPSDLVDVMNSLADLRVEPPEKFKRRHVSAFVGSMLNSWNGKEAVRYVLGAVRSGFKGAERGEEAEEGDVTGGETAADTADEEGRGAEGEPAKPAVDLGERERQLEAKLKKVEEQLAYIKKQLQR